MKSFGAVVSFDIGTLSNAKLFFKRLKLLSLAESLGGVETLISHPASMSHASVPRNERISIGITDGLIRISAGIEDVEDILGDIAQALSKIKF
jgi:cystathionine beta-lyase/cystathionine gamma-synthase